MTPRPPSSTLFPYTTLFRSHVRPGESSGCQSSRCPGDCRRCRSEEHTSELQSRGHLVCRLLLEKKKNIAVVEGVRSPELGGTGWLASRRAPLAVITARGRSR